MKKVSIIIPYYNTPVRIIEECLTSIYESSYKNIEVILINDGSREEFMPHLMHLKNKYTGLVLLNQQNAGPSAARNVGLDYATGEYISFIDSDDKISKDYIAGLVESLEDCQSEIACSNMQMMDERGIISHGTLASNCNMQRTVLEIDEENISDIYRLAWFATPYVRHGCVTPIWLSLCVWGKMYSSQILENVRFNQNLINGEDQILMMDCLARCKRISFTNVGLYFYRQCSFSLQHQVSPMTAIKYRDFFKELIFRLEYDEELLVEKLLWETRTLIELVYEKGNFALFKDRMNLVFHSQDICRYYNKISLKGCSGIRGKIMGFLIKYKNTAGIYCIKAIQK